MARRLTEHSARYARKRLETLYGELERLRCLAADGPEFMGLSKALRACWEQVKAVDSDLLAQKRLDELRRANDNSKA